jgi:hypothetical protein
MKITHEPDGRMRCEGIEYWPEDGSLRLNTEDGYLRLGQFDDLDPGTLSDRHQRIHAAMAVYVDQAAGDARDQRNWRRSA